MFSSDIFAKRVSQTRTSKKITQSELAEVTGLSKAAISMIENNKRAASIEVICLMADYFEVSVDYLVGRTDVKKMATEETDT